MAYTTPRTWVAGEVVTAALMNTHVRDNERALRGLDGVVTIDSGLVIDNTDGDEYLKLPLLSTAETATVLAAEGQVAFDEQTHTPKYYNGSAVKDIGDHGSLGGLTDDDHTQYQKESLLTTAGDIAYATAASTWARLGIGTGGQFLKSNTGATAPEWVSAVPSTIVYKAANETVNNSAVLQNDDALVLAVSANERYLIYMMLNFSSSAVADFKWDFAIPAASTLSYMPPNISNDFSIPAVTPAADGGGTLPGEGASRFTVALFRYVGGANAGNVQFRWAQNTGEVSDTIVYAGSFMLADKLV